MKVSYKSIQINGMSIQDSTKMEFDDNIKVLPIIGLNGSGKSILLKILSKLWETKWDADFYEPKFKISKDKEGISNKSFIKVIMQSSIISNENKMDGDMLTNYLSIIGVENYEKLDSYFKIYNGKNKFLFIPFSSEVELENEKFLEMILSVGKDIFDLEKFSRMFHFEVCNNTQEFYMLDMSGAKNDFFSKLSKTYDGILAKEDSTDEPFIDIIKKIISKILGNNWEKELKKELNGENYGLNAGANINQTDKIKAHLSRILMGENPEYDEESKEIIKSIFENMSGRRIERNGDVKPIRTTPFLRIYKNGQDYSVVAGYDESDIDGTSVSFEGDMKNDGFKLLYWYIIKTSFLIDDIENKIILIDELGNFLNPKVIKLFINFLTRANHKTIFTSHNPYSISGSNVRYSIHVCVRNARDNYSSTRHIKRVNPHEHMTSPNLKEGPLKIIADSLSIENDLYDWRIQENKTNIYVEGLSDLFALKSLCDYTERETINVMTIIGKGDTYSQIRGTYIYNNDETDVFALVDEDWIRGRDGKGQINIEERELLDKRILKLNEITNGKYFDLEDIFISEPFDELSKVIPSEIWNKDLKLKEINNSLLKGSYDASEIVTKIKSTILIWLASICQMNLDEIHSKYPQAKNYTEVVNEIVSKIKETRKV